MICFKTRSIKLIPADHCVCYLNISDDSSQTCTEQKSHTRTAHFGWKRRHCKYWQPLQIRFLWRKEGFTRDGAGGGLTEDTVVLIVAMRQNAAVTETDGTNGVLFRYEAPLLPHWCVSSEGTASPMSALKHTVLQACFSALWCKRLGPGVAWSNWQRQDIKVIQTRRRWTANSVWYPEFNLIHL